MTALEQASHSSGNMIPWAPRIIMTGRVFRLPVQTGGAPPDLRAGAFEILMRPDIDPPLTISEYVDVAKSFFERREPSLINGILDRLAREVRPGEMRDGRRGAAR